MSQSRNVNMMRSHEAKDIHISWRKIDHTCICSAAHHVKLFRRIAWRYSRWSYTTVNTNRCPLCMYVRQTLVDIPEHRNTAHRPSVWPAESICLGGPSRSIRDHTAGHIDPTHCMGCTLRKCNTHTCTSWFWHAIFFTSICLLNTFVVGSCSFVLMKTSQAYRQ